jgi:hypothetical protein
LWARAFSQKKNQTFQFVSKQLETKPNDFFGVGIFAIFPKNILVKEYFCHKFRVL